VKATLKSNGNPVSGKTITFSIGDQQATGTTNGSGVATASVALQSIAGPYQLSAGFAGTETLQPSGDSHPFSITKLATAIALSGPTSAQIGTDSGVIATLTAGGQPGQFKAVWFVLTGASSLTVQAQTDIAGKAKLGVAPGIGGQYLITACFSKPSPIGGCAPAASLDDNYSPSSTASPKAFAATWPFTGFFSPVDNPPTENAAKAGSNIPVKFSLGGNRGLNILATGYPRAVAISCSSTAPEDDIEEFTTLTNDLVYDAVTNRYQYNWKTPKSFAGTCQRLDFKFVDGTTYSALFTFK
jgi:hypothetical protein